MELKSDDISDSQEQSTVSSFSFLQQGSVVNEESAPVSSGFDFLSQNTDTTSTVVSERPTEPPVSSFSFLSTSSTTQEIVQEKKMIEPVIAPKSSHTDAINSLLSMEMSSPAATSSSTTVPIKLSKAASAKNVKKKKRASRVGFGRDDGENEAEDPPSPGSSIISNASSKNKIDISSALASIEEADLTPDPPVVMDRFDMSSSHQQTSSSLPTSASPPATTWKRPSMEPINPALADGTSTPSTIAIVESTPVSGSNRKATEAVVVNSNVTMISLDAGALPKPPQYSPKPPPESPPGGPEKPMEYTVPHDTAVEEKEVTPAQAIQRKSYSAMQGLADVLSRLGRQHQAAVTEHQQLTQELQQNESQILQLRALLVTQEEEQGKMVQLEEFEKADSLNESMEQNREELLRCEQKIMENKTMLRRLEYQYASDRKEGVRELGTFIDRLTSSRDQLMVEVASLQEHDTETYVIEQARLQAEQERIALEVSHCLREEEALESEAKDTEDAIQTQTSGFFEKKNEVEVEVFAVQEEIRNLEELLAAKRQEESKLLRRLEEVDGKIGEVRRKYDRQLQRIQDRRSTLDRSKAECLQEKEMVDQEVEKFNADRQAVKDANQSMLYWSHTMSIDISTAQTLLQKLSPGANDRKGSTLISELGITASDEERNSHQLEVDNASAALALAQGAVTDAHQRKEDRIAEAFSLTERVPLLEADKKSHAAAKRFKEAAAAAKEIKELGARKEALEREAAEIEEETAVLVADVKACEQKLMEAQKALKESQKLAQIKRFQSLLARVGELRALRKQIRKNGSLKGKFRMSELAETELRQRAVVDVSLEALLFVEAELDKVVREAAVIKDTYELEESLDPPADDDDVDDDDNSQTKKNFVIEGEEVKGMSTTAAVLEDVSEPVVEKEEEAPTFSKDEKLMLISEAKALMEEVDKKNGEVEAATEEEDYEKAAELFEEVTTSTEQLEKILLQLNCSREELDTLSEQLAVSITTEEPLETPNLKTPTAGEETTEAETETSPVEANPAPVETEELPVPTEEEEEEEAVVQSVGEEEEEIPVVSSTGEVESVERTEVISDPSAVVGTGEKAPGDVVEAPVGESAEEPAVAEELQEEES